MKTISCLAMLLLLGSVEAAQMTKPRLTEQHLDMLFAQAGELLKAGRVDEAKHLCRQILRQEPGRLDAAEFLKSLEALESPLPQRDPAAELKRKLETMVLPEVNFRDAKMEDVLAFLQKQTGLLSSDKTEVNFVSLLPAGEKLPPITVSLRRVPVSDVIRYVVELAGLRHRVEEHAVVIYKPEPPKKK